MTITGTKEWRPNSANCINGCSNRCGYCYGCKNALRFGRIKSKDEWGTESLNKNANNRIKFYNGGVMFPTTHDLKIEHCSWWMPFLRGLLKADNDVLIVSKPELESIHLICNSFTEYKDKIEFRFTIGTDDDSVREFWEPGAPCIRERLYALRYAYIHGYKTSVSMEPLLMENPCEFISSFENYVTDTIWIGCMNHMSVNNFTENTMCWYDRMKRINSYDNMKSVYDQLKDNPKIRWKDSVRDLLELK